jgi:hypothetical protein
MDYTIDYTKGPWEYNGNEIVVKDKPRVGIGGFMKDEDSILASAAPDMYEALKQFSIYIPSLWGDKVKDGVITLTMDANIIESVLCAITKAEGKG